MTRREILIVAATATVLNMLGLAWAEFVHQIGAMR